MNTLIIYANVDRRMRVNVQDHLYSFRRYSKDKCFYLNLAARPLPSYLHHAHFDLVIFHTTFLGCRWRPEIFATLCDIAAPLKQIDAVKIALPQDEFIYTDILCDFINEFNIDLVFPVVPESEWGKIFASVNRRKVKFYRVLTGYLDERTNKRIKKIARSVTDRPIDVGYRAWHAAPWLGRHGLLKVKISDLFRAKGPPAELVTDISTDEKDTLFGDDWYRFLLRCKYTIGVEGGASILDRDGKLKKRTEDYLALHPQASFEEVEEACFPNTDGSVHLVVLSPRHLEACLTRTCQVLVEGEYNGILTAGKHYIELKRDFSNIEAVLDTLKQDQLREGIVERAYQDIVESGLYTYRGLVTFVRRASCERVEYERSSFASFALDGLVFYLMRLNDICARVCLRYIFPVRNALRIRSRVRSLLVKTHEFVPPIGKSERRAR